ncbi:MAG: LemA family protein [Methanoregula sp.]|nr:LemA family protein [Methanoregula sp.]
MAALEISGLFVILGIIAIVLFFVITIYNGLISLRNNIDKAWANIDVLLKKRLDLIPNLVELVKGYATYERSVLEEITQIRATAMQAQAIPEKAKGSEAISASLGSVFALAENYPTLKASENFLHLQKELATIETQIAQRREFYNDSVLLYNTNIKTIPSVYLADWLKYTPKEYFRVEGDVETPLKINIQVPEKTV